MLFLVRWAFPYTSANDSWEPYVLLKNVDALHNFIDFIINSAFQTFIKSQEYKQIIIVVIKQDFLEIFEEHLWFCIRGSLGSESSLIVISRLHLSGLLCFSL